MAASLHRLVYFSRSSLPCGPGGFSSGIRDILNWSRNFNATHQTTGALMFSEGYFAQVLEGPAEIVKTTLGHISCDTRHRNLRILASEEVELREFPAWSMAFIDVSTQLDIISPGLAGESPKAADILAMLRWFVRENA